MSTLYLPEFNILKFPLGGAQQEVERVSRIFSGGFRKPFRNAFAAADAAAAAPTDPTTLGTLKLWYKPRALALSDNDPISTNTDYSGNGWDATAAGAARPTFKTNIVNGLAIARYDGSANGMDVAAGALGIINNVGSCTIVSVVSTTTVSAGRRIAIALANNSNTARTSSEINTVAAKIGIRGKRLDTDGSTQLDGATSISTSTFYILAIQTTWSAQTAAGYINGGTADASGTFGAAAGNTSATNSTNIRLGFGASGANFWSGDLGDQLVYVPALSLANLNLLGAYLGTVYGITWTTAT